MFMGACPTSDRWRNRGIIATLFVGCVLGMAASAPAGDPHKAATDLRAKYAAQLEQLAKWCEVGGLTEEARRTRRVLGPTDPDKLYVPVLPNEVGPPKLPADAPAKVVEWDARLDRLRHDHAVVVYELARQRLRRHAERASPSNWRWRQFRPIPITSLHGGCSAIRSSATSGARPTR